MVRKDYTSIRIEDGRMLKERFNRLFPDKNQSDTLELLLDNFSKVDAEGDKIAIWINTETYHELNQRGKVEDSWDNVIQQLLDREKVKPY